MQIYQQNQERVCLQSSTSNQKLPQMFGKKTDYVKCINEGNANSFFVNSLNMKYLMQQGVQLTNNCILVHISNKDDVKKTILNEIQEEITLETYKCAVISMRYNFDYIDGLFNQIVQNQNLMKLDLEFTIGSYVSESFDQIQNITLISKLMKYYVTSPSLKSLQCSIKQNQILINEEQVKYNLDIPQKLDMQCIEIIDELFPISEKLKVKNLGIALKSIFSDQAVSRIIQFIQNSSCTLQKINLDFTQIEEQNCIQILDALSQIAQQYNQLSLINIIQKDDNYIYKSDKYIQLLIDNYQNIQYNFGTLSIFNDSIKISLSDQEIIQSQKRAVELLIKNIPSIKIINIEGSVENIYTFLNYLQEENFNKRLQISINFLSYSQKCQNLFKLMISTEMIEYKICQKSSIYTQDHLNDQFMNQIKYQSDVQIKIMTFQILDSLQFYLYQKYNYLQYDLYFD